jgi:NADH-quinone oxidoreductase subunit E
MTADTTGATGTSDLPGLPPRVRQEMLEIVARYPQPRSALLPMLHLVQSYEGYVTPEGIELCADVLGITEAEVAAVATFYTMYKRRPMGDYHVGICTNTLCAVMGGDAIWTELSDHLGIGHDETTEDGAVSIERVECNAACDYAPVVMVNWEFFDNQTPESARELVEQLRTGQEVRSTRGPRVCTFREAERILAGYPDGRATQGPAAGPASLVGLELARERGWTAPAGPGEEPRTTATSGARAEGTGDDVTAAPAGRPHSGTSEGVPTAESDTAHAAEPGHQDEAAGDPREAPRDSRPRTGESPDTTTEEEQ